MNERSLHFVGIGGIGMSALARIALARGMRVTGSSDRESEQTLKLVSEGADVAIGHRAENVAGAERVVVTSAVTAENPELVAARRAGVPVLRRGELLAEFFNAASGIAIAGTHGKTTVTSMVATVLEQAGFDPTVAVGGVRRETGTNFRCGGGEWFVSEADESDGSFLALRPRIAVVTNIENDHIVSDDGLAGLIAQFETFLAGLPSDGVALLCADDARTVALASQPRAARAETFGFSAEARTRGREPQFDGFHSRCTVERDGVQLGELRLGVPGAINLGNALAATAVGLALGIEFATIATALATFRGVRRRFDVLVEESRMIVVDDYAHHPTAVAATIEAARAAHAGPIVAAFQPHRYSRTAYLADAFARSLSRADHVVLTEVYAASEAPIDGVDERSIGSPLARAGGDVDYVRRAQLSEYLLERAPEGALVLMLGAGDITAAAHELASRVAAPLQVA